MPAAALPGRHRRASSEDAAARCVGFAADCRDRVARPAGRGANEAAGDADRRALCRVAQSDGWPAPFQISQRQTLQSLLGIVGKSTDARHTDDRSQACFRVQLRTLVRPVTGPFAPRPPGSQPASRASLSVRKRSCTTPASPPAVRRLRLTHWLAGGRDVSLARIATRVLRLVTAKAKEAKRRLVVCGCARA